MQFVLSQKSRLKIFVGWKKKLGLKTFGGKFSPLYTIWSLKPDFFPADKVHRKNINIIALVNFIRGIISYYLFSYDFSYFSYKQQQLKIFYG